MSWSRGQVAEPGLDVAQAGAAAAQQRVGELDQPRVPADGAGQQLLVGRIQVGQGGQAQEHPPQLGRRQRRDRDLGQEPVRARQRVPAGDQQRPGLGRVGQRGRSPRRVAGSRKSCPPGVRFCSKSSNTTSSRQRRSSPATAASLGPSSLPGSVSSPAGPAAAASAVPVPGRAAVDGVGGGGDQGGGVPPALVHGDQPAVFAQPGRSPARPARSCRSRRSRSAPPRRPPRTRRTAAGVPAQHPHRGPQLGAAADQRPGRQFPHRPAARRQLVTTVSGIAGAAGSTSGPSPPAASSVATPYSGSGTRSLSSRARSSSARRRARASACPTAVSGPGGQLLVQAAGQDRGVPVGDRGQHRDHPVRAPLDQPGRHRMRRRPARARRQHDQRHRPARLPQRLHQVPGGHRDRAAVLILQLHRGRRPVRRQVQHVEHIPLQRLADLAPARPPPGSAPAPPGCPARR